MAPADDIDRRHMASEVANYRSTLATRRAGSDGLHFPHLRSTVRIDWIPGAEKSGAKQQDLLAGSVCVVDLYTYPPEAWRHATVNGCNAPAIF